MKYLLPGDSLHIDEVEISSFLLHRIWKCLTLPVAATCLKYYIIPQLIITKGSKNLYNNYFSLILCNALWTCWNETSWSFRNFVASASNFITQWCQIKSLHQCKSMQSLIFSLKIHKHDIYISSIHFTSQWSLDGKETESVLAWHEFSKQCQMDVSSKSRGILMLDLLN